jgi:hypothetical protein
MKQTIITICMAGLALASAGLPLEAMPRSTPVIEAATSAATPVVVRRGFYSIGGVFYYNGHRGYVYARRGYRYYRGYWFPAAAFVTGVAVGSVVAPPLRPVPVITLPAAHVRWCYARYVSYRAYDNSYQPYEGPRRQCWSPYS